MKKLNSKEFLVSFFLIFCAFENEKSLASGANRSFEDMMMGFHLLREASRRPAKDFIERKTALKKAEDECQEVITTSTMQAIKTDAPRILDAMGVKPKSPYVIFMGKTRFSQANAECRPLIRYS